MLVLRFENGPDAGREVELAGPSVQIGTAPINDLMVVDPKVAFEHCTIAETTDGIILRDLGMSPTGTRVNSADALPIAQPTVLVTGDLILIGATTLRLVRVVAASGGQRHIETEQVRAYKAKLTLHEAATVIAEPLQLLDEVVYANMVGQKADTARASYPAASPAIVVDPHPAAEDLEEEFAQYGLTARLVFLSGPHDRRRVFFSDGPIKVGRGEDNDVVIGDPQVKLRSFQITKSGHMFRLLPIDDRPRINGVETPKAGAVLGHGQVITIGANEIEFLAPGVDNEIDALETVVLKQPIFAFQGTVRKGESIAIGRDPECEIFLDDLEVERRHARLFFRMPVFHLQAIDGAPIYVDGARIIELRLKDGDSVNIGGHELRFGIQGYRINVELTPRPKKEIELPKFVQDLDVAAPFQTIVRLPGDWQIPKQELRSQEVDRAKLIWKEPHDVRRNWQLPLMVITGVAVAGMTAGILMLDGGASFLRRPISERHRSAEFVRVLEEKTGADDKCAGCHQNFKGPIDAQCEQCHPGQKQDLRPAHRELKELAANSCSQCHAEHPRATGVAALVNGQCATCHADRHQKMVKVGAVLMKQDPPASAGLFGLADIRADLGFGTQRTVAIHRAHGAISRGCAACHAGGTGERATPWSTCFACHGPVAALDSKQCGQCHREHGDAWAMAPSDPLIPASVAGMATATILLLLLPMGLVFFGHAAFKRRARWEEREVGPPDAPNIEPLRCDGVESAKAKRLPRLLMSKCTSSGDCVEICPYQVLEMVDKHPVVKLPELCHECGSCVDVCGPGALMMWEPDKALPMQPRPAIDPNYQTGVKGGDRGVYIIGEAAGKPLVKNGINVGFFSIHHMLHEGLRPGDAKKGGFDYELVIAGSGPSGISAALTARQENLKCLVLEKRDTFAATIQDYPKKKKLMESPPPPSPEYPQGVRLMGPLWISNTTREEAIERWKQDIVKVDIKYGELVVDIDPFGQGFVVKTKTTSFTCLRVILAPGTRSDPRTLGKPGDDLPKVRHRLIDAEEHNGHKVMIVGGGDSALEAAQQLCEVHGGSNQVCIVYRQASFKRAKTGNREAIAELMKSGRITAYFKSNPELVTEKSVTLDTGEEVENDFVYCMLGANLPTQWMESLGIKMVQKSIDWEPPPSDQPAFLQFTPGQPPPK